MKIEHPTVVKARELIQLIKGSRENNEHLPTELKNKVRYINKLLKMSNNPKEGDESE